MPVNRTRPKFGSARIQYQPRPDFSDLPGINDAGITNGQVLKYDSGTGTYVPGNDQDTTDHTLFTNIGTNTHAQIDTHIADSTLHFTVGSIDHTLITNVGTNTHAQIDTHIADTGLHVNAGESAVADGTVTGYTLRWNGSAWVESSALRVDPAGSVDLYHNGVLVANTTNQGMQFTAATGVAAVMEVSADVGQVSAINFEEATNTQFQFAYDAPNSRAYVRTTLTGEPFEIINLADGTMATFNGAGAVELYYNNERVFATHDEGVAIYDHLDSPNLRFIDNSSVEQARIQVFATDDNLYIDQRDPVNSGDIIMRVSDVTTSDKTVAAFRNAGSAELYHNGNIAVDTQDYGIRVRDTSGVIPSIELHSDVPAQLASLYYNAGLTLRGQGHGDPAFLQAEDTGGTVRTLFSGDPDGPSHMYEAGNIHIETQGNGLRTYGRNVANQGEWEMWDATALIAAIVSNGTNMVIYSNQNSEHVVLRGKTAAAANKILFEGDPDVGVGFFGATPFAPPTYSVTNLTTDRTYDANATSTAELADVLGTLIADLRSYGLVL